MTHIATTADTRSALDGLRRPPPMPPYSGPDAELLRLAHEARLHRARAENAYRSEVHLRHLEQAVALESRLFALTPRTAEGCIAISLHFFWAGLMGERNTDVAAEAWRRTLDVVRSLGGADTTAAAPGE